MSIIYRYGISLLDRKNHSKAEKQELMIDKETGQILLKKDNGCILSYDSATRFKLSCNNFALAAERNMFFGKIYSVVLDLLLLPSRVEISNDIIPNEVIHIGNIDKFMLQLDLDVLENIVNTFGNVTSMDSLYVDLTLSRANGDETYISYPLHSQTDIIYLNTLSDTNITSIKISSKDTEIDILTSEFIIHNILVATV